MHGRSSDDGRANQRGGNIIRLRHRAHAIVFIFYPFSFIRSFVPASFFFFVFEVALTWWHNGGGSFFFFFRSLFFSQVCRLEYLYRYDRIQCKLWG